MRYDITHVVYHLSQFFPAPTTIHHQAPLWILRYLRQTPEKGFSLTANIDFQFNVSSVILIKSYVLTLKDLPQTILSTLIILLYHGAKRNNQSFLEAL